MGRRNLKNRRKSKMKIIVFSGLLFVFVCFSVGYAAFSSNVRIDVRGTTKGSTLLTTKILNLKQNGDSTLMDDETDDHNVRYSGKNVNNYVCLKNEKPCSDDNLFRIIGVFNNIKSFENGNGETRVKLIKNTYYTGIKWDESGSNNWARPATLNTYLNSLSITSNKLIDNAVWYLGGNANGNVTASEMYSIERGNVTNLNNEEPSFWYGKVALISPSDYLYSSSSCHLLYTGNLYNMSICKDSNWLFIYKDEMLLNPDSRYSHCVLYISGGGSIYSAANVAGGIQIFIFRPSFYLKTTVKVINNGNDGSISKPYILTI